jgi:hypothetical protein
VPDPDPVLMVEVELVPAPQLASSKADAAHNNVKQKEDADLMAE